MSLSHISPRKRSLDSSEASVAKKARISHELLENIKITYIQTQDFIDSNSSIVSSPAFGGGLIANENLIQQYYQLDLISSASSNQNQFFELREQLLHVETFLLNTDVKVDLDQLRSYIKTILHSDTLNHGYKMSELGAILFYFEKNKQLPVLKTFYFQELGNEICQNIEHLHEMHSSNKDDTAQLLPSGKMHYLLSMFSQMILTEDQQLNRGALYCVLMILDPQYAALSQYLKPEHRGHLFQVISQIAIRPQFKVLFERQTSLHEDLQDMVRLDLMLPSNTKLTSVHVLRAALMAILFDVRQYDTPNCYAVSALIYSIQNGPYKVLSQLIEWLKTGYFSFTPFSVKVPLLPLIEQQLIHTEVLKVMLTPSEGASLIPIKKVMHTLGFDSARLVVSNNAKVSVSDLLKKMLNATAYSKESHPVAEKLYYSFQHNNLISLLLSSIQFLEANAPRHPQLLPNLEAGKKDKMICELLDALDATLKSDTQLYQKIREKLSEKIWFVDCVEREVDRKQVVISKELKTALKFTRRVFVLQNGKFTVIKSFSELKDVLKMIIRDAATELGHSEQNILAFQVLINQKFSNTIATVCAKQIKKDGVTGDDLLKADLFLLAQKGGMSPFYYGLFTLSTEESKFQANNAYVFLRQLFHFHKNLDNSIISQTPVFVMNSHEHAFTFKPKDCTLLWKNDTDYKSFVEQNIFEPASNFLKTPIPEDLVTAIINRYGREFKVSVSSIQSFFNSANGMTYAEFYELFYEKVGFDQQTDDAQNMINTIIDDGFSEIRLTNSNLRAVLEKLNFIPEDEQLSLIEEDLFKFNRFPHYPFQYAEFIRKQFIKHQFPVLNLREIEKAICDVLWLPLSCDIGDYNYATTDQEYPIHCRFVVRYHFGNKKLSYFTRNEKREIIIDGQKFFYWSIQYPKIS